MKIIFGYKPEIVAMFGRSNYKIKSTLAIFLANVIDYFWCLGIIYL